MALAWQTDKDSIIYRDYSSGAGDGLRDYATFEDNHTSDWQSNVLNYGITGLFSVLGSITSAISTSKLMSYYEQQESLYLQNANEQARRVQLKGDIALRNLVIKHTISEGTQELAAAASGGRLSGSNLDMLVQNKKYNLMDERTQSLQTLWEASNIRRQGLVQAMQTAGAAASAGYKAASSAISGLGKTLSTVANAYLKDRQATLEQNYYRKLDSNNHTATMQYLENYYGIGTGKAQLGQAGAVYAGIVDATSGNALYESEAGITSAFAPTGYTMDEYQSAVYPNGIYTGDFDTSTGPNLREEGGLSVDSTLPDDYNRVFPGGSSSLLQFNLSDIGG